MGLASGQECPRYTKQTCGRLPQRLLRGYDDAALKSHPCAQNAQGWGIRRRRLLHTETSLGAGPASETEAAPILRSLQGWEFVTKEAGASSQLSALPST
jgi:hypothetical protein